jgi:uncharacterized protein (DUF1330 family)
MTALFIGGVEVADENRHDYENVFLKQANKELADAGAKHIDGGFDNAVSLVGIPPKNRYVVIQFDSMDAAKVVAGPAGAFVRENKKKYAVGIRMIAANGVQE